MVRHSTVSMVRHPYNQTSAGSMRVAWTAAQRGIICGNSAVNSTIGNYVLTWQTSVIAGLILAILYSASPLFTITLAASAVLLRLAGRGLNAHEGRVLAVLI